MGFPLLLLRQELGARVWKTGLAVLLALMLFHLLAPGYATFAGIAAFLAVQPSVARSRQTISQQLLGNLAGAAVALALRHFFGGGPLVTALGVIVVLAVLRRFVLPDAVNLAVVMLVFVLEHQAQVLQFSGMRVAAVLAGTLIGYLVNRFVLPPNYTRMMTERLAAAGRQADQLLERVAAVLTCPEQFVKPAIKADIHALEEELLALRHYLTLEEEGGRTLTPIAKAVNSGFVFAEGAGEIHKAALLAGGLDPEAAGRVTRAIRAVLSVRQWAYDRVAGAIPAHPGLARMAELEAALTGLAELVHQRIAEPERRASGLTLHVIYTELQHMAWRLRSLERLLPR